MAILSEKTYLGDVMKLEIGEQQLYSRDKATLISGQANLVVGTVLGKIGISMTLTQSFTGTGNGTLVADVTTPVLANADLGAYKVIFLTATTFQVYSPSGTEIGTGVNGAAFADRIKFVTTAGGTAFIAGDTFLVTVAAGSLKVTALNMAATDGSQNAACVLGAYADATLGDVPTIVISRNASLDALKVIWPVGITGPQQAAATAQLAAVGIILRPGV